MAVYGTGQRGGGTRMAYTAMFRSDSGQWPVGAVVLLHADGEWETVDTARCGPGLDKMPVAIGVVVLVTSGYVGERWTVTVVVGGTAAVRRYWHPAALVGGCVVGFDKDLHAVVVDGTRTDVWAVGTYHGGTDAAVGTTAVAMVEHHVARSGLMSLYVVQMRSMAAAAAPMAEPRIHFSDMDDETYRSNIMIDDIVYLLKWCLDGKGIAADKAYIAEKDRTETDWLQNQFTFYTMLKTIKDAGSAGGFEKMLRECNATMTASLTPLSPEGFVRVFTEPGIPKDVSAAVNAAYTAFKKQRQEREGVAQQEADALAAAAALAVGTQLKPSDTRKVPSNVPVDPNVTRVVRAPVVLKSNAPTAARTLVKTWTAFAAGQISWADFAPLAAKYLADMSDNEKASLRQAASTIEGTYAFLGDDLRAIFNKFDYYADKLRMANVSTLFEEALETKTSDVTTLNTYIFNMSNKNWPADLRQQWRELNTTAQHPDAEWILGRLRDISLGDATCADIAGLVGAIVNDSADLNKYTRDIQDMLTTKADDVNRYLEDFVTLYKRLPASRSDSNARDRSRELADMFRDLAASLYQVRQIPLTMDVILDLPGYVRWPIDVRLAIPKMHRKAYYTALKIDQIVDLLAKDPGDHAVLKDTLSVKIRESVSWGSVADGTSSCNGNVEFIKIAQDPTDSEKNAVVAAFGALYLTKKDRGEKHLWLKKRILQDVEEQFVADIESGTTTQNTLVSYLNEMVGKVWPFDLQFEWKKHKNTFSGTADCTRWWLKSYVDRMYNKSITCEDCISTILGIDSNTTENKDAQRARTVVGFGACNAEAKAAIERVLDGLMNRYKVFVVFTESDSGKPRNGMLIRAYEYFAITRDKARNGSLGAVELEYMKSNRHLLPVDTTAALTAYGRAAEATAALPSVGLGFFGASDATLVATAPVRGLAVLPALASTTSVSASAVVAAHLASAVPTAPAVTALPITPLVPDTSVSASATVDAPLTSEVLTARAVTSVKAIEIPVPMATLASATSGSASAVVAAPTPFTSVSIAAPATVVISASIAAVHGDVDTATARSGVAVPTLVDTQSGHGHTVPSALASVAAADVGTISAEAGVTAAAQEARDIQDAKDIKEKLEADVAAWLRVNTEQAAKVFTLDQKTSAIAEIPVLEVQTAVASVKKDAALKIARLLLTLYYNPSVARTADETRGLQVKLDRLKGNYPFTFIPMVQMEDVD